MSDFRLKLRAANRSGGGGGGSSGGSYSIAYTVTSTGWLTKSIAAVQGEIPVGTGVSIAGLSTQLDVKNKWPDNSLRYGLITAKLASTGSKAILSTTVPAGSFTPTAPVFSVQFVITAGAGAGSTYTAALGSYSAADKWLDGPNVIEWRKKVIPTTTGPVNHDNLLVVFDVRSYSDGDHRINVQVLNARDSANMDLTTYTCTFINSGVTVFTGPSGYTQYTFTAWQQIVYIGSGQEGEATLDFTKFYSAFLLPKPLPGITNTDYTLDLADTAKFGLGKFGLYGDGVLNAPGANPWLSPFNNVDMQYLANQHATQLAVIKFSAFNAYGSWTTSYITRNDDTIYKVDDATEGGMMLFNDGAFAYPLRPRCPSAGNPYSGSSMFRGARDGVASDSVSVRGYTRFDYEHMPPVGLVAYFATGERCYLDMAKQIGNNLLFASSPGGAATYAGSSYVDPFDDGTLVRIDRNAIAGTHGVLTSSSYPDLRATARNLRNLIYAGCMCPDADTDRTYFLACGNDNFLWHDNYNTKRVAPGTEWGDGIILQEGAQLWQPLYDSTTGALVSSHLATNTNYMAEHAFVIYWANLQGIFTVPAGAITLAKRMVKEIIELVTHPTELNVGAGLGTFVGPGARRYPGALPVTYPNFSTLVREFVSQGSDQGGQTTVTVSANSSTFVVTAASGVFYPTLVGFQVGVSGNDGSNWNEKRFKNFGGALGILPIALPGSYTVASYIDSTHITLDRAPCSSNETGGTLTFMPSPPTVGGGNGPQSRLGIYIGAYLGVTNGAAAKIACDAYNSGEIPAALIASQHGYALTIPQS